MTTDVTTITRTPVAAGDRLDILPKYLGRHFLEGEILIYTNLDIFCAAYKGAYWQMYELSNGAFYMAPDFGAADLVHISVASNYYEGDMSPDAAGIVACLYAFNMLANKHQTDELIELFHALRDYAGEHPEGAAIFGAID